MPATGAPEEKKVEVKSEDAKKKNLKQKKKRR